MCYMCIKAQKAQKAQNITQAIFFILDAFKKNKKHKNVSKLISDFLLLGCFLGT